MLSHFLLRLLTTLFYCFLSNKKTDLERFDDLSKVTPSPLSLSFLICKLGSSEGSNEVC
jgi:hypothetical protein